MEDWPTFLLLVPFSIYWPFCVPAKVTKLIKIKNKGRLSAINLVIFTVTQNGQ